MVILGIILVLIALAVGTALIMGTSAPEVAGQDVDIQLFDAVTINLNPLTLVIAGMATMFVLWLGLVLIKTTLAHKKRQRHLRKEQEIEVRDRRDREEREHQEELRVREEELRRREATGPVGRDSAGPARGGPAAHESRPVARDDGTGVTRPIRPGDDPGATRPIRTGDTEDPGATRRIRRDEP